MAQGGETAGGPTRAGAARRWASELGSWAIPAGIEAKAPESPWSYPPEIFAAPDEPLDTPSRRRALELLPAGGTVIDVGAGGGAASLALLPAAGSVTAVDQSAAMLEQFIAAAARRGVDAHTVKGAWPQVAASVAGAEVVVCHHVLYNVADLVPFVTALTDHARRRVVVEITACHPMAGLDHLWRHFHGLARPDGPVFEDAVAVIEETGVRPGVERFTRPPRWAAGDRGRYVAFVRRRLCLPPAADVEIDEMLGPAAGVDPTQAVCLWWDTW